MIRNLFITIVLTLWIFTFNSNLAKGGEISIQSGLAAKRQVQSACVLHGKVTDKENIALPGATVFIPGTDRGGNANEEGEFRFDRLPEGQIVIRASLMGYKTREMEISLQPEDNEINIILEVDLVHLNPVTVTARKRDQQIIDVPASISVVGRDFIEKANITDLGQLSDFIPGLSILEQGANRPSFIIRGLTSEEVSPSAQPRVSVYMNDVPVNRANGASVALFDMERVEALKGPQNTLFGRGAQIGAVQFITKGAENNYSGYITEGIGSYSQREFRGALNMPLVRNKLFIRAAGLYENRDGFVKNTFGGTLNGINTKAGRLSATYFPAAHHKLDLILNYQKDETPGVAFMSRQFPNTVMDTSIFTYRASLEQGQKLRTGKTLADATLRYKCSISENSWFSSVTSYRKSTSSARWDGDGTAAPAIDMWEHAGASQFYQELRYNFAIRNRLVGSAGASYWHEKANDTYWFSPNEQSMALLFLNPANLILPNGQPLLLPALPDYPQLGPLAGMPLPESHLENNSSAATNQATEVFADLTYQLLNKLFVTGGVRAAYEHFELGSEAAFLSGSPSTLGMMTGNYPNLFFKPSALKSMSNNSASLNWQAGLQYRFSESANVFVNYSNGRRPKVLQYTSAGDPEVLKAEKVDNFDAGVKASVAGKIFIDITGFYQKYNNFQTRAWIADPGTGEFNYKSIDAGRATSYGLEASFRAALLKGLDLYGNYALLHAVFDNTDANGEKQEYAGNAFRLSPKHSFTLGVNAYAGISSQTRLFINPSFTYKTHFYFEDANTPGLDQPALGLLNMTVGIELTDPGVMLSLFGTNILDKQFITSAGNTGSLFGVPTFTPGAPRMVGAKVTMKF